MGIQRNTLLCSGSLCDSHTHAEDGIGTKLGLVLAVETKSTAAMAGSIVVYSRSVELVQEGVYGRLVLDVDVLLDKGRGDDVVDVGDGLGDALATPLGLVSITELASLMGSGGSTGWHDGAVQARLADEVDLDGGVTTRIVDGAGVNLCDGHVGGVVSGGRDERVFEGGGGEGGVRRR